MKKLYKLDNISSGELFRVEALLKKLVSNDKYSLNKEKQTLTIDGDVEFSNIESEILKINEDIDIVEKEYKQIRRKVLILKNLDCANCANTIERRAKRTIENEMISVDFNTGKFVIETTSEEALLTLKEEVKKIASDVDKNVLVLDDLDEEDEEEEEGLTKGRKRELIVAGIIFLLGFITKTVLNIIKYDDGFEVLNGLLTTKLIIVYATYIPAYVALSRNVLSGALRNAIHGHVFDEQFLMALATVVALAIKYYDEAMFVMVFYQIGEFLQDYVVDRTRNSIKALIDIQPQVAFVLVDDEVIEMNPKEVLVGDKIVIKTGEKVPLDGEIIQGEAEVDESALTGESLEKVVREGNKVLSGSILVNGNIIVRVEKCYEDSMVKKILDMVENASSKKSKSENFISKFARYYTPTVVILALLLGGLLPLISAKYPLNWEGYKASIRIALIFLVVSCPCALVLSVPLGFFGGIGGASKEGILIKGSNYLEALTNVKVVALDKTGTITEGKYILKKVISTSNYPKDKIMYYAAHAESLSPHPIAKTIVEAYNKPINPTIIERISEANERGIGAKVDGVEVWIGRKEYLEDKGIEINKEVKKLNNFTISIDGVNAGYFVFRDRIKSNAKKTIQELKAVGVDKVVMLTGDNEEIANEVAYKTTVDEYHSEMKPLDKVDKMLDLKEELDGKGNVAFVGDGVNDTPVLSASDIGIAMGALGSDAAIEVADVVLMNDDLASIPKAIKIAKKTKRIVIENVVLALTVKVAVLAISVIGVDWVNQLLMYEAIFADVGVSLLAVLNSIRAMKVDKE